MEYAEGLGRFSILPHRVGHASAGVHATQGSSNEREEHGEGLSKHEVLAMALPKERIADDDHHVADGRSGTRRALHRIPRVEEVVGAEVLDEVTEQPLNQQRSDDGDRNMFLWVFGFASHRRDGFKSHEDENGNRRLDEYPTEPVR